MWPLDNLCSSALSGCQCFGDNRGNLHRLQAPNRSPHHWIPSGGQQGVRKWTSLYRRTYKILQGATSRSVWEISACKRKLWLIKHPYINMHYSLTWWGDHLRVIFMSQCRMSTENRKRQRRNLYFIDFRTPSFSNVTNSNCVDLPACFFLKMNRPMPFSLSFIQRMGNATCEFTSWTLYLSHKYVVIGQFSITWTSTSLSIMS